MSVKPWGPGDRERFMTIPSEVLSQLAMETIDASDPRALFERRWSEEYQRRRDRQEN